MKPTASRGTLIWPGAILAGALSAASFAYGFDHAETLLIFLAYLAALPLFVAGLSAGSGPVILAAVTGTAGVFAANNNGILTAVYAVINALPVALLTIMTLRSRKCADGKVYWYPEGYLLTAMVLYPCVMFLGFVALDWNQDGGLLGQTTQMLQTAFAPMASDLEPDMAEDFKIMLDMLPRILPAIIGGCWIFLVLMSMMFGQSIAHKQKWNIRPTFDWLQMHIPNWLIVAAALTGIAAWFLAVPYDYIATNLCTLLCIPFVLVGLAVIHVYAATKKMKWLILGPVYVLLTILPWSAILVALLGVLEQVFHFRQRLPKKV